MSLKKGYASCVAFQMGHEMSNPGYQGGYADPSQQSSFTPMMPQLGPPMGGGAWGIPDPPTMPSPTNGPLPDDLERDGFRVPRRLSVGSVVPVTRCPDGRWTMSFVTTDYSFHFVVYVQAADGSFAPYHLEGLGSLRVAWDIATDAAPFLACVPVPSGKDIHVLHLPSEEERPWAETGLSA